MATDVCSADIMSPGSGQPQHMTHSHGTTASVPLYYASWICEFSFLCLIMMLVWAQKWVEFHTEIFYQHTSNYEQMVTLPCWFERMLCIGGRRRSARNYE